jgi:hypothetical protein
MSKHGHTPKHQPYQHHSSAEQPIEDRVRALSRGLIAVAIICFVFGAAALAISLFNLSQTTGRSTASPGQLCFSNYHCANEGVCVDNQCMMAMPTVGGTCGPRDEHDGMMCVEGRWSLPTIDSKIQCVSSLGCLPPAICGVGNICVDPTPVLGGECRKSDVTIGGLSCDDTLKRWVLPSHSVACVPGIGCAGGDVCALHGSKATCHTPG